MLKLKNLFEAVVNWPRRTVPNPSESSVQSGSRRPSDLLGGTFGTGAHGLPLTCLYQVENCWFEVLPEEESSQRVCVVYWYSI